MATCALSSCRVGERANSWDSDHYWLASRPARRRAEGKGMSFIAYIAAIVALVLSALAHMRLDELDKKRKDEPKEGA